MDWVIVQEYDLQQMTEAELQEFVGCWAGEGEPPIDRPLCEYANSDIAQAEEVALRVFSPLALHEEASPSPRASVRRRRLIGAMSTPVVDRWRWRAAE